MSLTINDLLKSLIEEDKSQLDLPNTKETWTRIGRKDEFLELGLEKSELESFLSKWTEENPYSNL